MTVESGIERIDKCLIFCPDAIGTHFIRSHRELFKTVYQLTKQRISLRSVFPPKTPVCFASMFTGAQPEQHGITRYMKPVLKCDTLFDAMVRSGKRVAIIAVKNSSIDLIFRERPIDYYTENYDCEVNERTLSLIQSGKYDLILAYQQEYDDILHAQSHECSDAINAVKNHVESFVEICSEWNWLNRHHNRMIVFAPDHGAHFDKEKGCSDHGLDIPDDMLVTHFYGFNRSK